MIFHRLLESVMHNEGFRGKPYKCTAGKTTIGYGRNLDDNPLTVGEGEHLLGNDMHSAIGAAKRLAGSSWEGLSDAQEEVLIEMAFQLGTTRLRGFRRMWAAIHAGDLATAKVEMGDSKWAKTDTPQRAARMMEKWDS